MRGHRILNRDPTGKFLEEIFTTISPELKPFEASDLIPSALITLISTIASLQTAQYEAQQSLLSVRAVQIGHILDVALVCLDQLIEVQDERSGNDEGSDERVG
jgi:hypothetical protein